MSDSEDIAIGPDELRQALLEYCAKRTKVRGQINVTMTQHAILHTLEEKLWTMHVRRLPDNVTILPRKS